MFLNLKPHILFNFNFLLAKPQYYNNQTQTLYQTTSPCPCRAQATKIQHHKRQLSHWHIHPVVGADFVYSFVNFSDDSEAIKEFAEDEYKAFSVSLGAQINQYFGIEGFYQMSEKGKSPKLYSSALGRGKIETSYIAYGVDLIGYLPTHLPHVNLLGSIGLGKYEFEAKYKGKYNSISETEDGLGVRIGAGIQTNINDIVSFRLMGRYSHLDTDDAVDSMIDLTAGLRFYFL